MKCKATRSGFTLTEMLIVIALMAIVMAFAVPAFVGMNEGAAMRASVSDLKATLSMARQWAITHRTEVFVVFPDLTAATGDDKDKAFHAYNVYSVREAEYVSEWRYLKPGIFFIPSQGSAPTAMSGSTIDTKNPFADISTVVTVPFPDSGPGATSNDVRAVKIRKNGQLDFSGFYQELYVAEGIGEVAAGQPKFVAEAPVVGLEIAKLTGGIRVKDYKIGP